MDGWTGLFYPFEGYVDNLRLIEMLQDITNIICYLDISISFGYTTGSSFFEFTTNDLGGPINGFSFWSRKLQIKKSQV